MMENKRILFILFILSAFLSCTKIFEDDNELMAARAKDTGKSYPFE